MTDTPTTIVVSSPGIPKFVAAAPVTDTLVVVPVGGPRGPQGDKGDTGDPGESAASFTHVQDSPSTVWLAVHNLGFKPADPRVTDQLGGTHYPRRISHPTAGVSTQLEFAHDVHGTADFS